MLLKAICCKNMSRRANSQIGDVLVLMVKQQILGIVGRMSNAYQ